MRCDHNLDQRSAPGFVPKGEVRQPGADASPAWVARSRISSQAVGPSSRCLLCTTVHKGRPRRLSGPGSLAGWVRGWGLGALHPALAIKRAGRPAVPGRELFSRRGPPVRTAAAVRARPVPQIDRQLDMPAVGKLEISQTDAKTPPASAATLHHVTRADREPAGEIICERSHRNPPREQPPFWNLPPPMPDQHDSSETASRPAVISVNRCGKALPRCMGGVAC
jgi:hypothetical protein